MSDEPREHPELADALGRNDPRPDPDRGLRDKFAMAALLALISEMIGNYEGRDIAEDICAKAYYYADAMMKARIQRTDSEPG